MVTSRARTVDRAEERLRSGPWFDALVLRGGRIPPWAAAVVLIAMLIASWLIVYGSGGSSRAMPHLFYIPIVFAALPFGLRGSVVTALIASVICGPLMPFEFIDGQPRPQLVGSWLFRALMFLLIGALANLAISARMRYNEQQLSNEVREAMRSSVLVDVDESLIPLVAQVLADRTFHPVFQPIYSLDDGRLLAVEALTRFDITPYRSPDRWFAAAHAAGLGTDLEIAVIEAAFAAALDLPPDVGLSLNASPGTLSDPRLRELITANSGREIVVEITEHAMVFDYHLLQRTLGELRAMGVSIAVDDAGAGFSSLRHIVQLAPETIKLDISLTQGVGVSPLRRALAGLLIEFAQRTGAQLVVEGIEEVSDLTTWTTLGAHAAQGFLIGMPGALPVAGHSPLIVSLRGGRAEAIGARTRSGR